MFSAERIMRAYWKMLKADPIYQNCIGVVRRPLENWERFRTINGIIKAMFAQIVREMKWRRVEFVPLPFGIAGTAVQRNGMIKSLRWLSAPLTRLPLLSEVANQNNVCILIK